MSPRVRLVVFGVGAVGFAVLWALAALAAPDVGAAVHPGREPAVTAALAHATANVVSAVNFDLRAFDTLGEETILLASVVAAAALLHPADDERVRAPAPGEAGAVGEVPVLPATRLVGWALLPVTVLVGADLVVHGHLTPGGGFQGGVVLATAVHLLYLAGSWEALQRARPLGWPPALEPAGSGLFVLVGLGGLAAGGGFLGDVLPVGVLGGPLSSGTVALLNVVVGIGVGAGLVHLLAHFLRQEIVVGPAWSPR